MTKTLWLVPFLMLTPPSAAEGRLEGGATGHLPTLLQVHHSKPCGQQVPLGRPPPAAQPQGFGLIENQWGSCTVTAFSARYTQLRIKEGRGWDAPKVREQNTFGLQVKLLC